MCTEYTDALSMLPVTLSLEFSFSCFVSTFFEVKLIFYAPEQNFLFKEKLKHQQSKLPWFFICSRGNSTPFIIFLPRAQKEQFFFLLFGIFKFIIFY